MRLVDLIRYTILALRRQRFRSVMLLIAVGLGVGAVIVLTALGEGARGYVMGEFAFLGKDTVVMFPGRKETTGGMPPITGSAARAITLEEVEVLGRTIPGLTSLAPMVMGNGPVSFGSRERESIVVGTTAAFFTIRQLQIAQGSALPDLALSEGKSVAVIGQKLKTELFDNRRAIGQWVRLRDYRFRVIGVLAGSGDSFGRDLSEAIFVPVASAQSVFNVHGLFRVMMKVRDNYRVEEVKTAVSERMQELHEGEQDVTVVSPDAMLSTFDDILRALTLGVAGIAAISLVVAGILVMNVTLMSVKQRTAEIGLLKAIGAPAAQVRTLFLTEAALIATAGALLGMLVGRLLVAAGRHLYPSIPFATPAWAMWAGFGLAVGTALVFAWLPAQQAARLEPVDALGRR
ncbi:MAG: ABC transporter permease [Gammaproteobacteria bacterium]|jgi:putative ABC transport system permease protein|nr:ABC transporter permease [Gammaproteobacteria bacterium]MDH5173580.1 ABC transporter permease [Gammaproteobacteria bacterium]